MCNGIAAIQSSLSLRNLVLSQKYLTAIGAKLRNYNKCSYKHNRVQIKMYYIILWLFFNCNHLNDRTKYKTFLIKMLYFTYKCILEVIYTIQFISSCQAIIVHVWAQSEVYARAEPIYSTRIWPTYITQADMLIQGFISVFPLLTDSLLRFPFRFLQFSREDNRIATSVFFIRLHTDTIQLFIIYLDNVITVVFNYSLHNPRKLKTNSIAY